MNEALCNFKQDHLKNHSQYKHKGFDLSRSLIRFKVLVLVRVAQGVQLPVAAEAVVNIQIGRPLIKFSGFKVSQWMTSGVKAWIAW
jgi:hypothetical protein